MANYPFKTDGSICLAASHIRTCQVSMPQKWKQMGGLDIFTEIYMASSNQFQSVSSGVSNYQESLNFSECSTRRFGLKIRSFCFPMNGWGNLQENHSLLSLLSHGKPCEIAKHEMLRLAFRQLGQAPSSLGEGSHGPAISKFRGVVCKI